MVQWVGVVAVNAGGLEFKSPSTHVKADMGSRTGGSLEFQSVSDSVDDYLKK